LAGKGFEKRAGAGRRRGRPQRSVIELMNHLLGGGGAEGKSTANDQRGVREGDGLEMDPFFRDPKKGNQTIN